MNMEIILCCFLLLSPFVVVLVADIIISRQQAKELECYLKDLRKRNEEFKKRYEEETKRACIMIAEQLKHLNDK